MITLAWTLDIIALTLLFISAIALFRAKDLFVMSQIIMASNYYILPLLLLGIELEKFSLISFAKIIAIIILNMIITNLVCHLIVKHAQDTGKLKPDADYSRSSKN